MKITAGQRGDNAREAKDKAENKFYWDAYKYSEGRSRMQSEFQSRKSSAVDDIRRQIDRLISDGYAKQIFEDDVDVTVEVGYGNKSYHSDEENSRRGEHPEQVRVNVSNRRYGTDVPFGWEWRARFGWGLGKDGYEVENDVSSYNFNSSRPNDIEYFAGCAEIFKALSKLNWNKILTTNYFEGMENYLVERPDRDYKGRPRYETDYEDEIKADAIEDALVEWKKGEKWIYVANLPGEDWDWKRDHNRKIDAPHRDNVSSDLLNGPGYYKYTGETGKYYRVEFMPRDEGMYKMKNGEDPVASHWTKRDKVNKEAFEHCIYYPITWWGRA